MSSYDYYGLPGFRLGSDKHIVIDTALCTHERAIRMGARIEDGLARMKQRPNQVRSGALSEEWGRGYFDIHVSRNQSPDLDMDPDKKPKASMHLRGIVAHETWIGVPGVVGRINEFTVNLNAVNDVKVNRVIMAFAGQRIGHRPAIRFFGGCNGVDPDELQPRDVLCFWVGGHMPLFKPRPVSKAFRGRRITDEMRIQNALGEAGFFTYSSMRFDEAHTTLKRNAAEQRAAKQSACTLS